ncbi:MAG TPA: peptidase M61, partial [Phenylobacterium sp.]
MKLALFACAAVLCIAGSAAAQPSPGPQPYPMPPKTEAPKDVAYPGLLKVKVDATDTDRHIFRVQESIPVAKSGPLTVLYPQWLPGNHAANGPIKNVGGISFSANGRAIPWM